MFDFLNFHFFTKAPKRNDSRSVISSGITDQELDKHPLIEPGTFLKVKGDIECFYQKRRKENEDTLNNRLKAARIWAEFILKELNGIPKDAISEITTKQRYENDLESIIDPTVYIEFDYNYKGSTKHFRFEVYERISYASKDSMYKLYEELRKIKKENGLDTGLYSITMDQHKELQNE